MIRFSVVRKLRIVASTAAVVVFATALPASAAFVGSDYAGNLYTVDPATGAALNPRPSGVTGLVGVDFGPAGQLYGLTANNGVAPDSFYRINPISGVSTLVGSTGLTDIFEGDIKFDPSTGTLYGLQAIPRTGVREFFTIDVLTGAAMVIGTIGNGNSDLSAMAFSSNGTLFVIDDTSNPCWWSTRPMA